LKLPSSNHAQLLEVLLRFIVEDFKHCAHTMCILIMPG
jgi:hypothetical protein